MRDFTHKINSIDDIKTLSSMKEEIKGKVMDYSLHWQDRIRLYKQVQLIKERIHTLEESEIQHGI